MFCAQIGPPEVFSVPVAFCAPKMKNKLFHIATNLSIGYIIISIVIYIKQSTFAMLKHSGVKKENHIISTLT